MKRTTTIPAISRLALPDEFSIAVRGHRGGTVTHVHPHVAPPAQLCNQTPGVHRRVRSLLPAHIEYLFDLIQGDTKTRSFRHAVAANLAAGLAAIGLATGCAAPPRAPQLPIGSNAPAIQRDGKRLLAHLSLVQENEAQPAGVTASHWTSKGDEQ